MSEYMIGFGEDFVEVPILSETNSVKYKLEAYASNSNSSPNLGMVNINGVTVATPTSGMNVYQLNSDGSIGTVKNFTFTNSDSAGNTAFTQFLNGVTTGTIWLILTDTKMYSSPIVDSWFTAKYSKVWPGQSYTSKYPTSSYIAIYSGTDLKIIQEALFGNDGIVIEDSRAYLETVFDTLSDIGSTGYCYRIIEDFTETTNTSYSTLYFPNGSKSTSLSTYGVSSGKYLYFCFDSYWSTDLSTQNSTMSVSLNWLDSNNAILSTVEYDSTTLDVWARFEHYLEIPASAVAFNIIAKPTVTYSNSAMWGIRNICLSQSSTLDKGTSISEIGVNGIRMYSANENATTYVLELPDSNNVSQTIIPFENVNEVVRE